MTLHRLVSRRGASSRPARFAVVLPVVLLVLLPRIPPRRARRLGGGEFRRRRRRRGLAVVEQRRAAAAAVLRLLRRDVLQTQVLVRQLRRAAALPRARDEGGPEERSE